MRLRSSRTAAIGLAGFIGLVVAQHLSRDDLPPGQHFVSEYANGEDGFVQVVAFVSWAVSLGVQASLTEPRVTRAALGVAAAGSVMTACFATVTVAGKLPDGMTKTTAGQLHDIGSLLIFAGLLVAVGASTRALSRPGYRRRVTALAGALLITVPVMSALGLDEPGWGQRAFIAIGCAWQALHLREIT